jgi:hypothetical protein
MTTTEMIDYRRTDLRIQTLENPYWITSAEASCVADDDLAAVLFSFTPTDYGSLVLVHYICIQITEGLDGAGTETLDIGACTLATDAVTTGGDTTDVDADEYIPTADITLATPGVYWPDGGDYFTARVANLWAAPASIVPAATTVPCIAGYAASDNTITAGKYRFHALISKVPLVG